MANRWLWLWRLVRRHKRVSRVWQDEALRLRARVESLTRALSHARQAQPEAQPEPSTPETKADKQPGLSEFEQAALLHYREQAREAGLPLYTGDEWFEQAKKSGVFDLE